MNIIDHSLFKVATDGCSTMIGGDHGAQTLLRQRIPTLPLWGGCICHDCSNMLKAAVPVN